MDWKDEYQRTTEDVQAEMRRKIPAYLFMIFLGVVVCGISYGFYTMILPKWKLQEEIEQTQALVDAEAKNLIQNWKGLTPKELDHTTKKDVWKQKLHYDVGLEPKVITAIVVSEGPDGELNTSDDIIGTATDINKSRIVGEWVGSKAKEGLKGIWDGLKKKSLFKKEEDNE